MQIYGITRMISCKFIHKKSLILVSKLDYTDSRLSQFNKHKRFKTTFYDTVNKEVKFLRAWL